MKVSSKDLLDELIVKVGKHKKSVEGFLSLSEEMLNKRIEPGSWSVLECMAHLNRYFDFYIPEIGARIATAKHPATELFQSKMLGNYFAKSMLPSKKMKKIKTFKSMDPIDSKLDKDTLVQYIQYQEELMALIDKARKVDISKTKTAISISKWLKLKLGDTFRVLVNHDERHLLQASQVLDHFNGTTETTPRVG